MPSPQSVLRDIAQSNLDPSKEHKCLSNTGHLKQQYVVEVNVSPGEDAKKFIEHVRDTLQQIVEPSTFEDLAVYEQTVTENTQDALASVEVFIPPVLEDALDEPVIITEQVHELDKQIKPLETKDEKPKNKKQKQQKHARS